MIDFSTITGIAIPEGSVQKIGLSSGATLWQKEAVVLYEPIVTLSLYKNTEIEKVMATIEVRGIPKESFSEVSLIYIDSATLRARELKESTGGRAKLSSTNLIDHVDSANVFSQTMKVPLGDSTHSTMYVYRAYIEYTDSDGTSKYVYSSIVRAKYDTLT